MNQFFGGLGGEEQADAAPRWFDGARGPGKLLEQLAPQIEIVGTVVFGDNYVAEHLSDGAEEITALIEEHVGEADLGEADLVLAGPAFNAGRYGMACGAICRRVQERLGIAALTALYAENPGVEAYRRYVTMVRAAADVMGMRDALTAMAEVAQKLVEGQQIVPRVDGTIARGLRSNYFASATGAERATELLLRKLAGDEFETEYAMPVFDRVPPAPAVADVSKATLALVTSGGIVPRGNPDRIPSASARSYGEYSIEGLDRLSPETHQSVHGGYDPTYANADPNRVLPLDVVRALEREGRIGHLYERYYATVGNATSVENAKRFGEEIAAKLVNVGVQAVIFTST